MFSNIFYNNNRIRIKLLIWRKLMHLLIRLRSIKKALMGLIFHPLNKTSFVLKVVQLTILTIISLANESGRGLMLSLG